MRVLVFGDSITQGYWDSQGGWVERLRRHYDSLAVKDLVNSYKQPAFFNLGVSGDTTEDLLGRIEAETKARVWPNEPQAVVIAIGANDSRDEDGEQWLTPEKFRQNLQKIIDTIKQSVAHVIFVGLTACDEAKTTPVFWRNITYTNKELKRYEKILEEVAKKNGLPFVPVFDEFKRRLNAGENLLLDGVHPNDAGHKLIVDLVQPELEKLLAQFPAL